MPDDPAPISLAERLKALESRLEPEDVSDVEKPPAPAAANKPSTRTTAAKKAPAAKRAPAQKAADEKATPAKAPAKKTAASKASASAAATKAHATKATTAKAHATKATTAKAPATKATTAKAPAKKAPAKKAPTAKATVPAATVAAAMAAVAAPRPARPTKAPRPTKAAPAAVRPTPQAASEVKLFDSLATAEPETPTSPPPPPSVARSRTPLIYRALMVASVVLFAGALGLFAAAIVESGAERWSSTSIVRLIPGPSPSMLATQAVAAGQQQYAGRVGQITAIAAAAGGVPSSDVYDLSAQATDKAELTITAEAAHAGEAERLAGAAAETLVAAIPVDQARIVTSTGDRLTAVVAGSVTPAEQIRPSDTLATVAGVLVAAGVLLFALCLWLIRSAGKD